MRGLVVVLSISFLLVAPVSAGTSEAALSTDRARYLPKRTAEITLTNPTDQTISFENPWKIERASGEEVANFTWDEGTEIEPGEHLTLDWNQWVGECSSAEPCTSDGWAGPGRYEANVETSAGTVLAPFEIGHYFTLGFRKRPNIEFTVFAARRKAVRQMRAEADAEEKSLIVSGIVGAERGYNDDWSYTMRPGSLVLGEAFIEVCDAAPEYVEENLDEWRGERWCPWSSYVERKGR